MKSRTERLGTEKVGVLLLHLSTPAIVGMLVNALYNVADAIFIGRGVGTDGLAGVSIALPFQTLLMALAGMVGMGGSSIISRRLGAGRGEEASRVLGNVISLVVLIGALVALTGLLLAVPLLRSIGATEAILPYASDYLRIVLGGSVFLVFAMAVASIVRAEGNARLAMTSMILAGLINLVLDPLFIFTFKWGVRGAALATVIAQAVSAALLGGYFLSGHSALRPKLRHLLPTIVVVREIVIVGLPAFVRHAAGYVMYLVINAQLVAYGSAVALAAFGVSNRILMMFLMPAMGIIQGMQPIVGFNYGARQLGRVRQAVALAVTSASIVTTFAFVVMMIFPAWLIRLFSADPSLIASGKVALRFIFAAAFLIGAQMVAGGFYQALGRTGPALILSIARQVIFLIPLVLILPGIWGLTGIWAAFPLADVCAFLVTAAVVMRDVRRGLFRPGHAAGGRAQAGPAAGAGAAPEV